MTTPKPKPPLYSFQELAVQKMAKLPHVLLFDEMGLGKTLQALEHVQRENLKPCLIICPKTLMWNWYSEIIKWYPDEIPILYRDTDSFLNLYMSNKNRFFIIWHDVLSRFKRDQLMDLLPKLSWSSIIVDEMHLMRNWETQRGEALMAFNKGKKILLTGTPIVNSADDLYPMMYLIGITHDSAAFRNQYCYMTQDNAGRWKPRGFKNREGLMSRVGDMWIARTKQQVLKDLPEKLPEQVIRLEMEEDQKRFYDNLITMLMWETKDGTEMPIDGILAMLIRLRQAALDPILLNKRASSVKTKMVLELLENTREKALVYTNFETYVTHLTAALDQKHIRSVRLTGKESLSQRNEAVKDFQTNKATKVFVSTMQSGGTGLTLTAASTVIITDLWWNRARISQAIDRAHRIGQTMPVQPIILSCRESIDEHLEKITNDKDAPAKELLQAIIEKGY